jgi:hypothetical protein
MPRFFADAMLGRLARWLRVLGYDTAYHAHIADADLVWQAQQEQRCILTRDRALPHERHLDRYLLIESQTPLAQLREVVQWFHLPWQNHLFSRCMVCNTPLQDVSPQDIVGAVPPTVLQHQRCFVRCPTCARVYWEGSHAVRMRCQLARVFTGDAAGGAREERKGLE